MAAAAKEKMFNSPDRGRKYRLRGGDDRPPAEVKSQLEEAVAKEKTLNSPDRETSPVNNYQKLTLNWMGFA